MVNIQWCLERKENSPLFQGKGILYLQNTKFPYGDTHGKYVNDNQHVKLLNQTQVNTIIHRYGIKYIPIKMRCCCKGNKELRAIGVLRLQNFHMVTLVSHG